MEKPLTYVKVIAVLGVLSGLFGLIITFKFPGNIALAPLVIGLTFGLIAFLISKNKKSKCPGSWVAIAISAIGIIITLTLQTKEAEVPVDKQFEEKTEKSALEGENGLDNLFEEEEEEEEQVE